MRLPCFWLLLLFFPCRLSSWRLYSKCQPYLCPLLGGGTSFNQHIHVEHTTLTPDPLDGDRLSRKPSQKWNWRTPFCVWRHASRAPWQVLSFTSVIERGFVLFMQRSVNAIGTAVFLHSPNTTVHAYFCCL